MINILQDFFFYPICLHLVYSDHFWTPSCHSNSISLVVSDVFHKIPKYQRYFHYLQQIDTNHCLNQAVNFVTGKKSLQWYLWQINPKANIRDSTFHLKNIILQTLADYHSLLLKRSIFNPLNCPFAIDNVLLGVKIRNLKVDFKTGGSWHRVGQ